MSGEINVETVLKNYLVANDFDGLVSQDGECSCLVRDLVPCDSLSLRCEPGYRVDYQKGKCPCGEGCEFHVFPGKRP